MSDLRELLDHEVRDRTLSPASTEDVMRRVRRRQRTRRLAAGAIGLSLTVALVAGGVFVLASSRGGQAVPTRPRPPSSASTGVRTTIPEQGVMSQAVGFGSVWTLTCDTGCSGDARQATGTLFRSDPTSGQVLASFLVPTPQGLVLGDDGAWVVSFWDGSVTHFVAATGTSGRIPLALPHEIAPGSGDTDFLPQSLAAADGSAWVSTARGELARIDEGADRVVAMIDLPGDTTGPVAVGERSVWVAENVLGVFRIDPSTNAVADRITVDGPLGRLGIDGVGVGGGSVWASGLWAKPTTDATGHQDFETTGIGGLAQIDPATGQAISTVWSGVRPSASRYQDGAFWMAAVGDRAVVRSDAKTGRSRTIRLPVGHRFVALAPGAIWTRTDDGRFESLPLRMLG